MDRYLEIGGALFAVLVILASVAIGIADRWPLSAFVSFFGGCSILLLVRILGTLCDLRDSLQDE